jgi:hypothetical protein
VPAKLLSPLDIHVDPDGYELADDIVQETGLEYSKKNRMRFLREEKLVRVLGLMI